MHLEDFTTITSHLGYDTIGPINNRFPTYIFLLSIALYLSFFLYIRISKHTDKRHLQALTFLPALFAVSALLSPSHTKSQSPVLADNYTYTITTRSGPRTDDFGVNQNLDGVSTVELTFDQNQLLPDQLKNSSTFLDQLNGFTTPDHPITWIVGTIGDKGVTLFNRHDTTINDILYPSAIRFVYDKSRYLIVTKEALGPMYDELVTTAKDLYNTSYKNPFNVKPQEHDFMFIP